LKAADLIVQNLAGSLALVTCREPLKMSLTTNLKKALTNLTSSLNEAEAAVNEASLNDICQLASRENLELGCKLIKKNVIQKALAKVREDP
jgi:CCR4-NOT transcription complex subunit 1